MSTFAVKKVDKIALVPADFAPSCLTTKSFFDSLVKPQELSSYLFKTLVVYRQNRSKPENFYGELELVFSRPELLIYMVDKASRMEYATMKDPGMHGMVGGHLEGFQA